MLAILLSWLPSWVVSFGAGIIGAAGIAAIVYSLLPIVPYRRTIQIAGTLAICWAVYQYGIADAQAVHEAAQLRAQVADRNAIIEDQNEQIRRVQALNSRLSDISAETDTDIEELRDAVAKSEAARLAAHKDDSCDYTDADLGRVRNLIDRARRSAPQGGAGR